MGGVTWPFGALPMFHYRAIYADPPWRFENYSAAGEAKNAVQHYGCMDMDAIAALPVGDLAHGDGAALFLWATNPMLPEALQVMRRWGFRYATVAFTWAKRSRTDSAWHMGLGYWTRANTEICLLGVAGRVARRQRDVRELVVAPLREHSRKPDRVRDDIRRLVAGPYVELFARAAAPGWDVWGNQVGKFQPQTEAAPCA